MSNKAAPREDADRKHGGNIHNKAEKLKSIFKVSTSTLFEQVASPAVTGGLSTGTKRRVTE